MSENENLPYGKQWVTDEDIEYVTAVLRSDWLTTGPVVEKFELELARKTRAAYCVVFNSGTAALHAAYFAAGIGCGDEVITSPITFAATANAALYLGARPVFADIATDSFHLDPGKVEAVITSKTKAIVPVDMAGMPADLAALMTLKENRDLVVIEDACHALGASYDDRPVGAIADMTVFSFHPVKQITSGEGGAVTTGSEEYYKKLKLFRNHGIERESQYFSPVYGEKRHDGPWYYEQQLLGYNYRLPDINCALGLSQLKRLDSFIDRRRYIAEQYNQAFRHSSAVLTPPLPFGDKSIKNAAWHLYILRLSEKSINRSLLFERLNLRGIGTQVHYIPVYLHPYYQKLGYRPGLCPKAEEYYEVAFSIPIYPKMSDQDVCRVSETINDELELLRG